MNVIDVVIIGLASWRLASLLTQEDGPGLIFEKLRDRVGANEPGEITGFLPTLFSCVYCMSVWTTIAATIIWLVCPIPIMILAAMTIALLANHFAKPE